MDNRELMRFDNFDTSNPAEILSSQICENWSFDKDNPENSVCLIPSLVPPLRLKPILSKAYIDIWHAASQWLNESDKIIIIGYSLNTADEHFNDLLRAAKGKQTIIIAPDTLSNEFIDRVSRIFGTNPRQLTSLKIQNHNAKTNHGLKLIEAKAHEIDLSRLAHD